jgi:predicted TIM-barrel fold metal-dependent hydrolase
MIDANVFIGESLYDNSLSTNTLLEMMKVNSVERAVVRSLKPPDFDFDRANRWIAETQSKYSNLIGFGRVNPLLKQAPEQALRAVAEYGLQGIHLHPWEENYQITSEKVDRVIEALEGKVPVYVSAGYPVVSHPLQIQDLAGRHTDTIFIVTHGGQQDISGMSFDDALIVARENPNVCFDVSGVYRRDFIEQLVEQAGVHRIVFGSCTPYMDMAFEITRVRSTHLQSEVKDKIFRLNILRILGLSDG